MSETPNSPVHIDITDLKLTDESEPIEVEESAPTHAPEEEEITPAMYMNHRLLMTKAFVLATQEAITKSNVDNAELTLLVKNSLEAILSPYPDQIPSLLVDQANTAFAPLVGPLKRVLARCELAACDQAEWSNLPSLESVSVTKVVEDEEQ